MKTICCFCFLILTHLACSQVCSENIKLRANSSRYITLCSDDQHSILAHIDADNEITDINILSISGTNITAENNLAKGCIYAGNCCYQNSYLLLYFKPQDKESYSLCCLRGNIQNLILENRENLAIITCNRKQLPTNTHSQENNTGIYVCIPSYTSGKENTSTQLLSFDKSMQPIREKKLTLPYGDHTLETLQILPDSAGNFYILAKQRVHTQAKNFPARHFLFYYNFQRNALKEYDLQLHGKNISGTFLNQAPNNAIIISGFYSNDMTMQSAGVFHSTIKPLGGSMTAIHTHPFQDNVMDTFADPRSKSITIPDLELDGVLIDSLGISLWGERRYSTEHSGIDPLTGRVYNEVRHHNDQIVIARIDTSGQLKFNHIIHKQQVTTGETQYMSYHAFRVMQSIRFAFNDHPTNQGEIRKDANVWYSSKTFVNTFAEVSQNGEIRYTHPSDSNVMRIIPRLCNGKMILSGEGKTLRLCAVE